MSEPIDDHDLNYCLDSLSSMSNFLFCCYDIFEPLEEFFDEFENVLISELEEIDAD